MKTDCLDLNPCIIINENEVCFIGWRKQIEDMVKPVSLPLRAFVCHFLLGCTIWGIGGSSIKGDLLDDHIVALSRNTFYHMHLASKLWEILFSPWVWIIPMHSVWGHILNRIQKFQLVQNAITQLLNDPTQWQHTLPMLWSALAILVSRWSLMWRLIYKMA